MTRRYRDALGVVHELAESPQALEIAPAEADARGSTGAAAAVAVAVPDAQWDVVRDVAAQLVPCVSPSRFGL